MNFSPKIERIETGDLSSGQVESLRSLFAEAWSGDEKFTPHDWEHAMGGVHFVVKEQDRIVAHAAVVKRILHVAERALVTGYVEAVATRPAHRRKGFASTIMRAVNQHIDNCYELGALDTGQSGFYARFGWRTWQGPAFVRTKDGIARTPEEDGHIMVRPTPASPPIDLSADVSCDWRAGDVW